MRVLLPKAGRARGEITTEAACLDEVRQGLVRLTARRG